MSKLSTEMSYFPELVMWIFGGELKYDQSTNKGSLDQQNLLHFVCQKGGGAFSIKKIM